MQELRFDEVELYLAEPNREVRQVITGALSPLGLKLVKNIEKLSLLKEEVEAKTPDLIIAEVELGDGNACGMFYAIRHHRIGNNPFVPIISTSWEGGEDLVQRVIDSGADDLLIKPFSTGLLIGRIKRLVHFRKPFVVTTDYIGPDRRKMERAQVGDIPLFNVPNTLEAKATGAGKEDHDEIQKTIDFAITVVNEQKMLRHAHQIAYLTGLIVPGFKEETPDKSLEDLIERLIYVAGDLARRMEGTRFSHVSELCATLLRVTNALREKAADPHPKDLKLLPELAQAIEAAFTSDEKIVALAREISISVGRRSAG